MPDYYNLLGVPPEATAAELRRAYRARAKAVHPDAHPDLPPSEREAQRRRFILLAQAYETLSDPERRARYDRQRPRREPPGRGAGSRQGSGAGGWRSTQAGFGRGRPKGGPPPGPPEDGPGLEDLLRDVESLLGRFGLDLQPPFEALLESLLEWARAVFRQVMEAWEAGEDGTSEGKARRPDTSAAGTAGHRGRSGSGAGRRADPAADAAKVREDLEALRRRVGSRPARETDVEAELRRLKARLRRSD